MIAGSEEQKQQVPDAHRGRESAERAFGLSEPQAGSDVMGMRTKAVERRRRAGSSTAPSAGCRASLQADWYTVFAKTAADVTERNHDSITAFIVERAWDGVEVGVDRPQDGRAGVDTGELLLNDVHVPAENVIGEVGGFPAGHAWGSTRCARSWPPAASGWPRARSCTPPSTCKQREAFRQTIADFQGIQWEIAKLATEIEAARLLTYRAAWLADQGKFTKEWVPYLSMAKYYATELAVKASNVALQMLGAAGYMKDHLTELYYRDAKQLTIVEGTSQVQLGLIARGVLDRDLWWD